MPTLNFLYFDVVWFLRKNTPLNVQYFEACMRKGGELGTNESLTEVDVVNLLTQRVAKIDLEAAKEDVFPFLKDTTEIALWSVDFFKYWFSKLCFAPRSDARGSTS